MNISAKTRKQINQRDNGCCRRCGNLATNVHHRIGRGMGGSKRADINDLAALVMLCGSGTTGCHGLITSRPEEAYREGWSIRRSDPEPAESVPLFDIFGDFFWLTDDGGVIYATTPRSRLHL
jgi:hypothetical protein